MKKVLFIFMMMLVASFVTAQGHYINPLVPNFDSGDTTKAIADPSFLYENGTYYMYCTRAGFPNEGIPVWTSTDMVHWANRGWALHEDNSQFQDNFWAPDIKKSGNTYYLYYSASSPTSGGYRMCVASSNNPLGPFTNEIVFHPNIQEIDGQVFIDTDGTWYIYFCRFVDGQQIFGARMNSPTSINDGTVTLLLSRSQSWEMVEGVVQEGPLMLKNGNTYYLTYSANLFTNHAYGVGYATSTNPLGGFTKYSGNPILQRFDDYKTGLGHHGIAYSPGGEMFIMYHEHFNGSQANPRKLAMDRLSFNGSVLQVNVGVGGSANFQPLPSGIDGTTNINPPANYVALESHNFPDYYMRHNLAIGRLADYIRPIDDAYFRMVPGLAGAGISFQSINFPDRYLRHAGGIIYLKVNDGSGLFAQDATFYQVAGLADGNKSSFMSYNFPDRYIRHQRGILRIDPVTDDLGRQDATWAVISTAAPTNTPTSPPATSTPTRVAAGTDRTDAGGTISAQYDDSPDGEDMARA
ncbi:MAG: family 43 glycosylhydrolase, partial [Spirochaetales bacterium]|nr:family 43 glycosylhydrolase [Spirochaetales bacterium]